MKRHSTVNTLTNALLFQCCWYFAVFDSAFVAMICLFIMLIHICLVSESLSIDFTMATLVFSVGVCLDSLLTLAGLYSFPGGSTYGTYFIPPWLMVLWLAFALSINQSLHWLVVKGKWFVMACAVAGPVSYLAGRQAGVIDFQLPMLPVLMVEWLIVAGVVLKIRMACQSVGDRRGVCHV